MDFSIGSKQNLLGEEHNSMYRARSLFFFRLQYLNTSYISNCAKNSGENQFGLYNLDGNNTKIEPMF